MYTFGFASFSLDDWKVLLNFHASLRLASIESGLNVDNVVICLYNTIKLAFASCLFLRHSEELALETSEDILDGLLEDTLLRA